MNAVNKMVRGIDPFRPKASRERLLFRLTKCLIEYAKNGEEHPGSLAYRKMVKLIGGHPFKKPLIEHNVFYAKDVEYMVGLITESFLNEEV